MFVRLERCKDNLITAGGKSELSLYRPDIATMESGESVAEWSVGVLEYWNAGEVECWSLGLACCMTPFPCLGFLNTPLLHDSIAPLNAMVEKQAKKK